MNASSTAKELVVVTGASTGIGRATALRLAADGYHVLAGVRRPEDGATLRAGATAGTAAGVIEPVIVDVTDAGALAALADRIGRDAGRRPLRAVVNNAGIAINAPVETAPLDEWRRQFEVSVIGQIAVTQALIPALLASGGRVINIGSVGGMVAMPGFGPYSAAKFAMEAVSATLRRELGPLGVKVVVITPGAVKTNLTERGITTADRLAGLMTPDQHGRYDRLIDAFKAQAETYARDGVPPERAAAVISRAVAARKPSTRYTVGRDAALLTRIVRFIPDRALDGMLRRTMKL